MSGDSTTSSQHATDPESVILGNGGSDYAAVEVPTTKPHEEFSAEERRAAILDIITDVGHPSRLNQTELAERFGVSQPMIHKDLDALSDYVADNLGDRHELEIESVFRRSIQGLLDEGEWRKAARTAKEYSEWMTERTDLDEIQDELEFLREAHQEKE
ncbi:hypothetical protein [Halorhabdus amylolytica]|uniref:hypothetical protein n=1 Tax=Halorhabdus amylolytica TaxID=2559573 RepID=UPI0010AA985A|nr:hypothetical protein [Halorhabdus amylolytica]